jgi:glycosyltransferase involved in cell wall biosynthesis
MSRARPGARPVRTGGVSVVVAELDGDGAALDAVADLDLPGEGHELVIAVRSPGRAPHRVGSLPVREVRVVVGASLAEVRNAAAAAARGEFLAFLGPGAAPAPRWVTAALAAFRADARVAAVAARPRAGAGTGEPDPAAVCPVLFGAPAGLVVETRAFHWVGGYPAGPGAAAAEADLGWRLWSAGMVVVTAPGSVVAAPGTTDDADAAEVGALLAARVAAADADAADEREHAVVRVTELAPLLGDLAVPAPRVLVVTPDVLAPQMAGPAIRAFELSRVLDTAPGIGAVELVSTVRCDLADGPFPVRAADDRGLREAVARADVVVVQGHVLDHHPWLVDTDRVVVVDAYDPIQLEVLEQARDLPAGQRRMAVRHAGDTTSRLLGRGDRFLVASAKQRDLLVGQLAAAGRLNVATYDGDEGLHRLIGVVPFGIPDEPPVAAAPALRGVVPGIGPHDPLILWGGGVYNWFDPLTLLRAVDRLRARLPDVRLFFMGMHHPHPEVPEMEMARRTRVLAAELGLVGSHVFFNEGWVAYDARAGFLLEADVGVSTHLDHVETAFSYRTRILDYLWAALPVVATGGDAMADLVAARGFGTVVPAADVEALERALHDLLADRDRNRACRDAITAARDELVWTHAAADLVTMCERPRRAADLVDPRERAVRGDRAAAAVWGVGWEASARGALAHVRRGEWDDLSRKARARWAGRGR